MKRVPFVRSRVACRSLLWGLLGFVALQVVAGLVVEVGPEHWRDPDFEARTRLLQAHREKAPEAPLLLMLGSSRTLCGFNAGAIDVALEDRRAVAFNFGLSGAGPLVESMCLRRLLERGVRPSLLLVEVLPACFTTHVDRPLEERWLQPTRLTLPELVEACDDHSHPFDLAFAWCRARGLPCIHPPLALARLLGSGEVRVFDQLDDHGWHAHRLEGLTAVERRKRTAGALHQYRAAARPFRASPEPARLLRELLGRCRSEGIAAALVVMPESTEFRALIPPPSWKPLEAHLDRLAREEKVPLIDARTWVPDEGFFDGHHLLPSGAQTFTQRLAREHLPTLVQGVRRHPGAVAAVQH